MFISKNESHNVVAIESFCIYESNRRYVRTVEMQSSSCIFESNRIKNKLAKLHKSPVSINT